MKIREIILEKETKLCKERLDKLVEMGAPAVIIENLNKVVSELESGVLKIGGSVEKLYNEVTGYELKRGNGGKPYIEFSDGTRYFPYARYGKYIA